MIWEAFMRRVQTKVSDAEAKKRLVEYRMTHGNGPHRAATLADVIWPDAEWIAPQGAGAASSRVLKRLGAYWMERDGNLGWILSFQNESSSATARKGDAERKGNDE